ncbi:MAG TPA: histidine kinase N-terminal domain-containing protein [Ornithinimicrobium sp.]|uniref:sensor histidine kinase n=1 Tax=Ornithinimicrobium sp. TaxID=1977084 RepID=UPI002B4627D6|nr:histidine kinase N-terminal domain-containing protein [Ornithinimicrobium sp.]HKJ12583.1 histidine kinase N-terminal domain-containing protein [Ornithinimicrobium sp.]
MPTLHDVLSQKTAMSAKDAEWLHRLVGDWQMIADLSFADLTLWAPRGQDCPDDPAGWVLAAHARPSTGPNFYADDVVGSRATSARAEVFSEVSATGRSATHQDAEYVREQYVPVVRAGTTLGVLVRHTDLHHMRQQGGLEVNYLHIAQALLVMISQGTFPADPPHTGVGRGTPRVGDGVVRLGSEGSIEYASPNAVSALRRLGHTDQVIGADLSQIVTAHLRPGATLDEAVPLVLTGRAPWGTEIETEGLHLTLRAVPLHVGGRRTGALLLLRDVSELRRQERELVTKDATIREVHHRVKNNLQTVSALLRLQSRRVEDATARAALREAGRRLSTVAMVHDTLSHGFDEIADFDQVATRVLRATAEVAANEVAVEASLSGAFGPLQAEDATALAMVLAELVQNAVEHGFAAPGWTGDVAPSVHVHAERRLEHGRAGLTVRVTDNGLGLPGGSHAPATSGLGMQIVESLLADVHGSITWERMLPHGTSACFTARLRATESGEG